MNYNTLPSKGSKEKKRKKKISKIKKKKKEKKISKIKKVYFNSKRVQSIRRLQSVAVLLVADRLLRHRLPEW